MSAAQHPETNRRLDLSRWKSVPLGLILLGGIMSTVGAFVDTTQFGYSWLLSFMFFLSIVLGSLFLVILHHLFDASWSVPIRRLVEHISTLAFPWMLILFVPILLLAPRIYPWMAMEHPDHSLHAKQALFNKPAFYIISVLLFLVWGFFASSLRRWSLRQDQTGSAHCTRRMRVLSASGIFVFALTLTLGAIYWMKSLQHQFFSTMYGVYYFAGSVWLTFATVYVLTMLLARTGPLASVVGPRQYHDIGVLFFAFTVFYAYIHFSQYFLIWNAAIPEETFWYVMREQGSWWGIGMIIIFGHFFFPFLTLLRIDAKLSLMVMLPMAAWAWLMHWCDMSFNIMPVLHPDNFVLHWIDVGTFLFMAGLLSKVFIAKFLAHPPFPTKDPRMSEAMGVYLPPSQPNAGAPEFGGNQ